MIHVMMYGYYAMALLGYKCPWKARLTQMQLGQFCIVLVHSLYCWYHKTVPAFLCGLELFVMAKMLVLFSQFYFKSYSKKATKRSTSSSDAVSSVEPPVAQAAPGASKS